MTVPAQSSRPKNTVAQAGHRPSRTALYRFYGQDGELLYVGITKRLQIRWREHARNYATTWWPKVRSNTVHWYPNRAEAGRAERQAIRTEGPLYNVLHTHRHRVPLGQRASSEPFSEQRGDSLLEVLKENFTGRPFTALDAVSVAPFSPSTVEKNINALLIRGLIVVVGARHLVMSGTPRRASTLYSLPINEWVNRETGAPLDPAEVPTVQPEPRRKRLPVPKQRNVPVLRSTPRIVEERKLESPLPPIVTFTSGAALLEELGLVDSITREGVRFISRSPDWPFGPGKKHPYGKAGKAATMDTEVFLEYFRSGPRRGGVGRKPEQETR